MNERQVVSDFWWSVFRCVSSLWSSLEVLRSKNSKISLDCDTHARLRFRLVDALPVDLLSSLCEDAEKVRLESMER